MLRKSPIMIIIGFASGLAIAAVPSTESPYATGEVLTAARLNADFANIEARLSTIETGDRPHMRLLSGPQNLSPSSETEIPERNITVNLEESVAALRVTWSETLDITRTATAANSHCFVRILADGQVCSRFSLGTFASTETGGRVTISMESSVSRVTYCRGPNNSGFVAGANIRLSIDLRCESGIAVAVGPRADTTGLIEVTPVKLVSVR